MTNDADISKQLRDRLEGVTALVAADLRRYLDDLIDADDAALGEEALRVTVATDGISAHDGAPLLFVPETPPAKGNRHDAGAGALVRTAGALRAAGRWDEALDAYRRLTADDDAYVFGSPASLEGALARLRLFDDVKRREDAVREGTELRADLLRVRWAIDRVSFENAWQHADRAEPASPPPAYPRSFALAVAVAQLWKEWRDVRGHAADWRGQRSVWIEDVAVGARPGGGDRPDGRVLCRQGRAQGDGRRATAVGICLRGVP